MEMVPEYADLLVNWPKPGTFLYFKFIEELEEGGKQKN